MITGETKKQIDYIWDTFGVDGIINPKSIQEQMNLSVKTSGLIPSGNISLQYATS
jgi:hypothetical protein